MHEYMYIDVHVSTYRCKCTCMYMYIQMSVYTRTHTYINKMYNRQSQWIKRNMQMYKGMSELLSH